MSAGVSTELLGDRGGDKHLAGPRRQVRIVELMSDGSWRPLHGRLKVQRAPLSGQPVPHREITSAGPLGDEGVSVSR